MLICIDSNPFIFGIEGTDPASEELMLLIPDLEIAVPRLIMQEVTRNLDADTAKLFYALINMSDQFRIVDEPVPAELVEKYVALGLPAKADAVIGGFTEWMGAKYLVSDNRHFLQEFSTDAFEVLEPAEFVWRFHAGKL